DAQKAHAPVPSSALPGLEMREVLRTRAFWMIVLATLLAAGPGSGLMPHFVPYLASRGIDARSAARVIAAMSIAMAAGTVVGGWAVDWAKGAWIAAPFSALSALAIGSFMITSKELGGNVALATAAVAAMGFAMGAHRPMGTYFQLGFFGLKTFGTI